MPLKKTLKTLNAWSLDALRLRDSLPIILVPLPFSVCLSVKRSWTRDGVHLEDPKHPPAPRPAARLSFPDFVDSALLR